MEIDRYLSINDEIEAMQSEVKVSPQDLQTRIREHLEQQQTKAMPGFDVKEIESAQNEGDKVAILERHEEDISERMSQLRQ